MFFFAAIFEIAAYGLNILSAILAPFVLIIVILEPYAKRYTAHRHLLMGFVIGLGILGGYVGASGQFPVSIAVYGRGLGISGICLIEILCILVLSQPSS